MRISTAYNNPKCLGQMDLGLLCLTRTTCPSRKLCKELSSDGAVIIRDERDNPSDFELSPEFEAIYRGLFEIRSREE